MQRPDQFTIDPYNHLSNGLVLAALGNMGGSAHHHDSARHGFHGTLQNMEIGDWQWGNGINRACLNLGGSNEYVTYGNQSVLDFKPNLDDFTLSTWVKINSGVAGTIISRGNSGSRQYQLYTSSNILYAKIGGTSTNYGNASDGTWHHVALRSYDPGIQSFRMYIDGAESGSAYGGSATANVSTLIGARRNSSDADYGYVLTGRLADAMIWNRALSVPEIQQLADPSNVMLSGLIMPPVRKWFRVAPSVAASGRIMSSLAQHGGLVDSGGIVGPGGGLAG